MILIGQYLIAGGSESEHPQDRHSIPGDVSVQCCGHPSAGLGLRLHLLTLGRLHRWLRSHDHVLRLHWSRALPRILQS